MTEWPKPWDDVIDTPDDDTPFPMMTSYVDLGAVRIANDTVYIAADGGQEGENRDLWEPLEVYLP